MIRIVIVNNHRQTFQVLAKKKKNKNKKRQEKLLNDHNVNTTEEKF